MVYEGPTPSSSSNTSLVFVSSGLVLYSSGSGDVSVLYTGNRTEGNKVSYQ